MIKAYLATVEDTPLVTDDRDILRRFLLHNKNSALATFCTTADEADIVILFERWSFKLPGYGKQLVSDPFFRSNAKKLFVVNYDSTVGEGFLPGCYVSLQRSKYQANRFRSCAYPKVYNEFLDGEHDNLPVKYLFSFRGTLHSHPVRATMYNALSNVEGGLMIDNTKPFHTHDETEKRRYVEEILQSHFVLCPRGSSPSSYRLYETMSLARCPVIVSDEWLEPEGPDWGSCSIRIAEKDIDRIPEILSSRIRDAAQLGKNASLEWERSFSEGAKNKHYLKQLVALYSQSPPATKSAHEYQQHWRSQGFLYNNSWTLLHKIWRRLSGLLR